MKPSDITIAQKEEIVKILRICISPVKFSSMVNLRLSAQLSPLIQRMAAKLRDMLSEKPDDTALCTSVKPVEFKEEMLLR